ncbi:MAG: hypothetical protein WBG86_22340 [Polyangiales bacterium]
MLPDFEGMAKARIELVPDPEIQRGIDLHHETDGAFHRTPAFLGICKLGLSALTESGVRRGTARAVAHIGAEMFLDGWLAQDSTHVGPYLDALDPKVGEAIAWSDRGVGFDILRGRLARWGAPHDYRDPAFVLKRLEDSLRSRPRLAILENQRDALASFLPRLRSTVEHDATELLNQVRDALGLDR